MTIAGSDHPEAGRKAAIFTQLPALGLLGLISPKRFAAKFSVLLLYKLKKQS